MPPTAALLSIACTGFGTGLFWSSTRCGFCLDDHLAIEDNFDISSGIGGAAFWHDFWGRDMNAENSHKSWRPLTIITFQLNYLAGGLEPWGYHAVNAVLHGCVCGAVVHLMDHKWWLRCSFDGSGSIVCRTSRACRSGDGRSRTCRRARNVVLASCILCLCPAPQSMLGSSKCRQRETQSAERTGQSHSSG